MGKSLAGKELGVGFGQRKDGVYFARWTKPNGKRITVYDKNITKLRNDVRKLKDKEPKTVAKRKHQKKLIEYTFDRMFNLWIESLSSRRSKSILKNTIDNHIHHYNKHLVAFGKMKIDEIMVHDCIMTIDNIYNSYCYNAARVCLTIMNGVFEYAILNQVTQFSPSTVIHLKYERKKQTGYLSINEENVLLEEMDSENYRDMIELVIHTGLRVGELFGLSKSNIDLQKKVLYVKRQIQFEKVNGKKEYVFRPPKYNSKRTIPLDERAFNILAKHLDLNLTRISVSKAFDDLLFLNLNGKPYSSVVVNHVLKRKVKRIKEQQGFEFQYNITMHIFRHTFATRCLEAGLNTRVIQTLLGHKEDTITQQYAHVTENKIVNDFDLIQDYYNKLSNQNNENGTKMVHVVLN